MIKTIPREKMSVKISPSVHSKKSKKGSTATRSPSLPKIKTRKRIRQWITTRCCCCCLPCGRWVRKFLLSRCCCCSCGGGRKNEEFDNDEDIDRAVEEYIKQKQLNGIGGGENGDTLKSENSIWKWDESWKSNSDKFLETLELECVGSDRSLKRAADKLRKNNSKVRKSAMLNNFHGGGFCDEIKQQRERKNKFLFLYF